MTTARALARRLVLHPTLGWPVRLVRPGWPDAGRLVAQSPALRPLLATVASRAPSRPIVVNAGAGEGLYTTLIHRLLSPSRVIEFDLQVPPARVLDGTDHRRLRGSLTAIPLATHSADVVVCTEVLEHVPDDAAAAAEISRVLKPGGLLVASVPTPPAVFDPAHVREGYTRLQLDRLFGAASLEILDERFSMFAVFQFVLRSWREGRMPLAAILVLAWIDRWTRFGLPMDIAVLARRVDLHAAAAPGDGLEHRP